MRVSLLIPAYNEQENIDELLSHIVTFFKENNIDDWEAIIIDDGSTDDTWERLVVNADRNYNIKTIRHRKNLGVSDALLTGFLESKGKYIVYFPADLQFHLDDVLRMVKKAESGGYDIVLGKKVGKYGKRFVSFVYNKLSSLLFHLPVTDLNSIKLMSREVLEWVPIRKDWHRYIVPLAYHEGFTVTEIDVKLYPRLHGYSKFKGFRRIIIGFLDLIAVKFQITFAKKPMLFFGSLALISILSGSVIGFIALYLRFILNQGYRPLIFLVILLILMGLILFTVGFLGELIAAQNDRLNLFLRRIERKNNGRLK